MKLRFQVGLCLALMTGNVAAIALAQPTDLPERVRANAIETTKRVCLFLPEKPATSTEAKQATSCERELSWDINISPCPKIAAEKEPGL